MGANCALDYPKGSFRVVVLDDSASKSLASTMSAIFNSDDNVYYTTRKERISIHSKAGNLSWGLKYTTLELGGVSEFLAVLDADMIPTSDWLRMLLPHLLESPNTAMVSPPQRFFNIPKNGP